LDEHISTGLCNLCHCTQQEWLKTVNALGLSTSNVEIRISKKNRHQRMSWACIWQLVDPLDDFAEALLTDRLIILAMGFVVVRTFQPKEELVQEATRNGLFEVRNTLYVRDLI
jgi:hypothetical protein